MTEEQWAEKKVFQMFNQSAEAKQVTVEECYLIMLSGNQIIKCLNFFDCGEIVEGWLTELAYQSFEFSSTTVRIL